MAKAEIAQFLRVCLRLNLVTTQMVEDWVTSLITAEPIASFPFTELASASHLRREAVEELLREAAIDPNHDYSANMVMAFINRALRAGNVSHEFAIKLAMDIAGTDKEQREADKLDDALWLASSEMYGDILTVRHEIELFFKKYSGFENSIPPMLIKE